MLCPMVPDSMPSVHVLTHGSHSLSSVDGSVVAKGRIGGTHATPLPGHHEFLLFKYCACADCR